MGRQDSGDVIHPAPAGRMVAPDSHGVELDPSDVVSRGAAGRASAAYASNIGAERRQWPRAVRLRLRHLCIPRDSLGACVLLLGTERTPDGGAAMPDRNVISFAIPARLRKRI